MHLAICDAVWDMPPVFPHSCTLRHRPELQDCHARQVFVIYKGCAAQVPGKGDRLCHHARQSYLLQLHYLHTNIQSAIMDAIQAGRLVHRYYDNLSAILPANSIPPPPTCHLAYLSIHHHAHLAMMPACVVKHIFIYHLVHTAALQQHLRNTQCIINTDYPNLDCYRSRLRVNMCVNGYVIELT